jgi:UDP-N-acetylglucosamine 2-epimerase (non-hydrolysing)
MNKIAVVFGTRPEAIKLAPVIREFKRIPDVDCKVWITAQHRQMLDQALGVFDIVPDTDLDLMAPDQSLSGLTATSVAKLDDCFGRQRPDLVLVQGDTTTSFCAALVAFYHHVPVGHVEAGLRTWNLEAPWPEEANRILTARLTALHFAPTEQNRRNLLREGVPAESIFVTGNTVIDALLLVIQRLRADDRLRLNIEGRFPFLDARRRLILVTGHRRENFGAGLENICRALRLLGERSDVQIVYPVHLNPRVQEPVRRMLGQCPSVHLIAPQDYVSFVYLMDRARLIITDSGGIQEEACTLGRPVLVMREATERPEVVEGGTARLVGSDSGKIVAETVRLLDDRAAYEAMTRLGNSYGDGKAAGRIQQHCCRFLSQRSDHA